MTQAEAAAGSLFNAGIRLVVGVPCSLLSGLIDAIEAHPFLQYVTAANEGDAVAIAAGAGLAGKSAAVLMQNSGLGNAVSPLTSLISTFGLPLLMIIGWRGGPAKLDEPQHALMGEISPALLRLCQVEAILGQRGGELAAIETGIARFQAGGAAAVLIEFGMNRMTDVPPRQIVNGNRPDVPIYDLRSGGRRPIRSEVLGIISHEFATGTAIVSTTGYITRELAATADRPAHFYQVGSMGCATSIGLGLALTSDKPIVVLDGDGAALMRLSALATIGAEGPAAFTHILLDNGSHASTGGQHTAAKTTDLGLVAAACGYASVHKCDDVAGLRRSLNVASERPGPRMIHVEISAVSSAAPDRISLSPCQNADRFAKWMMDPKL